MFFDFSAMYATVFIVSLLGALLLTPFSRRLAMKYNFYDIPGERKVHTRLIPYLGGLGMYLSFIFALISVLGFRHQLITIVVASTFMVILGLVDDKQGMNPKVKLSGQILAALFVINTEVCFNIFGTLWLDGPLTLFWIVGITNAINLLDNMDGLSSGVSAISALTLFFIAARNGQFLVASLAVALVGVCLGFLRYNFSPASIFMGDSGSMFLGFMLSSTAVKLHLPTDGTWAGMIIPVLALGLPILDTTLVTVQRYCNKRPIYLGGKDHCSHRLVALGFTHKQAVLTLYVLAGVYGLTALLVNGSNLSMWGPIFGFAFCASIILFMRLAGVSVYETVDLRLNRK
jgi:UDP-GlcNAc:undecaprenyl-phosphate GlcNAc-1-phosphate transferase